jgi:hypothetical protein
MPPARRRYIVHCIMRYELEPYNRDVRDEKWLADLGRVAKDLGKDRLTIDEYNERGRFHSTTLTPRFGSWFAATDKAGPRRTQNLNIPNEELFANLVELWTSLGQQPRYEAGCFSIFLGHLRKTLWDVAQGSRSLRRKTGDRRDVSGFVRLWYFLLVARFARVIALDSPLHVTQRGNARQFILTADAERLVYLDLLRLSVVQRRRSLRNGAARHIAGYATLGAVLDNR